MKCRLNHKQLSNIQGTTKNCFIPINDRKKARINCIIYINHEYLGSRREIRYFQDFEVLNTSSPEDMQPPQYGK